MPVALPVSHPRPNIGRDLTEGRYEMYVDPGLGALLLQGVVAGIVGAVFVARQKIRLFFRRLLGKRSSE